MKISFHFVWLLSAALGGGRWFNLLGVCSCSVSRVEFISKVAKRKETDRDADRK